MRCATYLEQIGQMKNACKIVAGKYEEQRELGRPKLRCEGSIKMDHERDMRVGFGKFL
jgi:hypothetical protein